MAWMDELALSLTELANAFGMNPTSLGNRRLRDPEGFPRPVQGSGRSSRYRLQEVVDWSAGTRSPLTPSLVELLWLATLATTSGRPDEGVGVGRQLLCLVSLIAEREGVTAPEIGSLCEPEIRRTLIGIVDEAMQEATARGLTASDLLEKVLDQSDRLGRGDLNSDRDASAVAVALVADRLVRAGAAPPSFVYDPALGVGSLAFDVAQRLGPSVRVSGVELDEQAYAIALLRGRLRDLQLDLRRGNALEGDRPSSIAPADVVVSDLPVMEGGLDPGWINHITAHLSTRGWGVVMVPEFVVKGPALLQGPTGLPPRTHAMVRLPRVWQGTARAKPEVVLLIGPELGQDIAIVDAADWRGGREARRSRGSGSVNRSNASPDATVPDTLAQRVIATATDPNVLRIAQADLVRADDPWKFAANIPAAADLSGSIDELTSLLAQMQSTTSAGTASAADLDRIADALERVATHVRRGGR